MLNVSFQQLFGILKMELQANDMISVLEGLVAAGGAGCEHLRFGRKGAERVVMPVKNG
ncbi:hypothetical protein D3C73_1607920 [compost metagenome]